MAKLNVQQVVARLVHTLDKIRRSGTEPEAIYQGAAVMMGLLVQTLPKGEQKGFYEEFARYVENYQGPDDHLGWARRSRLSRRLSALGGDSPGAVASRGGSVKR